MAFRIKCPNSQPGTVKDRCSAWGEVQREGAGDVPEGEARLVIRLRWGLHLLRLLVRSAVYCFSDVVISTVAMRE